jgi:hypothetical protein
MALTRLQFNSQRSKKEVCGQAEKVNLHRVRGGSSIHHIAFAVRTGGKALRTRHGINNN